MPTESGHSSHRSQHDREASAPTGGRLNERQPKFRAIENLAVIRSTYEICE